MKTINQLIELGEVSENDVKNIGSFDDAELPFYSSYLEALLVNAK